jgi:hypothetical protein
MDTRYHARWVSKPRANVIKRSRGLSQALLLDTVNGFLIVEPIQKGSALGDGAVLSEREADYELHPAWYTGPVARLREARRRLGLDTEATTRQLVGSGA